MKWHELLDNVGNEPVYAPQREEKLTKAVSKLKHEDYDMDQLAVPNLFLL